MSTRGCRRCGGPGATQQTRHAETPDERIRELSWLCPACIVQAHIENAKARLRSTSGWTAVTDLRDMFW